MSVINSHISAALPNAPALASAFTKIARGEKSDLSADLVELEAHVQLAGTRAHTHCYALALDGMGWPRSGLLVDNICGFILDYAMPRSRIQEAVEQCETKNSQAPIFGLATKRGRYLRIF